MPIAAVTVKSKTAADVGTGHIPNYATSDESDGPTYEGTRSGPKRHVVYSLPGDS